MYQVSINKALNGFVVNVGCQTLVFLDKVEFLTELSRYMDNPDTVEKEYRQKYGLISPVEQPVCQGVQAA